MSALKVVGRRALTAALAVVTGAYVVAALASCGNDPPAPAPNLPPPTPPSATITPTPFEEFVGDVYQFETVVDGIKRVCLIWDGGRGGGLQCWEATSASRGPR